MLTSEESTQLETVTRKYTAPYRDIIRAKVVLLAAKGLENKPIAERLDLPRQIVAKDLGLPFSRLGGEQIAFEAVQRGIVASISGATV